MNKVKFDLDEALPYLNVTATTVEFEVRYPSGWCYWVLQTEDGKGLKDGNYTFSEEVLAQWQESDDVLINDLKAAAPWLVSGSSLI